MTAQATEVLQFWFGSPGDDATDYVSHWFKKDAVFDQQIRERFGELVEAASKGQLDEWAEHGPNGALALLLLLDQFPRNIWRDTMRAYTQDVRAREICIRAMDEALDRDLAFMERAMFYAPLMHAESRQVQEQSVRAYRNLVADAERVGLPDDMHHVLRQFLYQALRHAETIELFGRFPQRNEVMGRRSTIEEAAFMRQTAMMAQT